jgi:S-adenosylmethionine-dependent methyltransferase
MALRDALGRAERAAHDRMRWLDQRSVPAVLKQNWRPNPTRTDDVFLDRLHRDRTEIVPWLASFVPLDGARLLEIGCGRGASTVAMTEQGASVVGLDVNAQALAHARGQLEQVGLEAELVELNAANLDELPARGPFDVVIFWASLEHMVVAERLAALRHARNLARPGTPIVVVETPNRLWPQDSHTSWMAYFNWLPDELAFHVLADSPRDAVRGKHVDAAAEMLDFQRLGRGVSFHEFDQAWGHGLSVVSCMQVARRKSNPIRALAWRFSSAGRTERALRHFDPDRDIAWFQPFLYVALTPPET